MSTSIVIEQRSIQLGRRLSSLHVPTEWKFKSSRFEPKVAHKRSEREPELGLGYLNLFFQPGLPSAFSYSGLKTTPYATAPLHLIMGSSSIFSRGAFVFAGIPLGSNGGTQTLQPVASTYCFP